MAGLDSLDTDGDSLLGTAWQGETWRRIKRWSGRLLIALAFILLFAASLASIKYGPQGYRFVNDVLVRPYAKLYAPTSDKSAVVPLFDKDTLFDVAVTIWQRRNCTTQVDGQLLPDQFLFCGNWDSMELWNKSTDSTTRHVDETILFSQVVMTGFSLQSKPHEATINFELPPTTDDGYLQYDLRAAVTFQPQTPSLLDKVSSYTAATPMEMVVPPSMGEGILSTGTWGDKDSVRRQVLDALTVHIPLIKWDYNRGGQVVLYYLNRAEVYIVDETHPLERDAWLTSFKALQNNSAFCSFPNRAMPISPQASQSHYDLFRPSWHWCSADFDHPYLFDTELSLGGISPYYYSSKGHFLAKYELESSGDGEDVRLAYNPFMGSVPPAPWHRAVIPRVYNTSNKWYSFDTSAEADLPDVPKEPVQAEITLQMSVFSPIEEKLHLLEKQRLVSSTHERFRNWDDHDHDHDDWAFSNGLIGNHIEGAHTWRRVSLFVIHKSLAFAVAVLTIIYWYTRKTAAGISHWSIWMRVAVVLPSSLILWLVIVTIDCLSEFYQLRLVFPIDLRTSTVNIGGDWRSGSPSEKKNNDIKITLKQRRWTRRERATMRLEPKWTISMCVFLACMAFFFLCRGWIIPPARPAGFDRTEADVLARLAKSIGWAGYICANILQLVMNHHTGTFAGTYALVAYLQLGVQACNILYNFSFVMGKFYEVKGLSVFELSTVVSAIAVVYQAATLPRVEQVVPDDEEEE